MEPEAGLVQPLVVLRSGSHHDAIRCVAEVSLRAYLASPERPEWGQWLSGIFTKSVRRAKAGELARLAPGAAAEVRHGDAAALGTLPRRQHAEEPRQAPGLRHGVAPIGVLWR